MKEINKKEQLSTQMQEINMDATKSTFLWWELQQKIH